MRLRSPEKRLDTIVFLTGYGDHTLDIKLLTKHWPFLYGIKPVIHKCGTARPASEYPRLLEEAEEAVEAAGPCVVAGRSFGGLIGAILLDKHPDLVKGLITFSTPFQGAISREAGGEGDFSLLNRALADVNGAVITKENTLAYVGSEDDVAPPATMLHEHATGEQLWVPGHGAAIVAALVLKQTDIARFAHRQLSEFRQD